MGGETPDERSLRQRTSSRRRAAFLVPFMLLFAVYVVVHGHDSPGGGFQGGVICAAAFILIQLVRGTATSWGLSPDWALVLACTGVGIFVGIGLLSLVFGGSYLDYGALSSSSRASGGNARWGRSVSRSGSRWA